MSLAEPAPPADPRKRVMDLLARCSADEMRAAWDKIEPKPTFARLREPETGLVMVRGRMGGGGSPFNLGEATVSRATIQLTEGTVGHGYRLGTDKVAAEWSAVFAALWQLPAQQDRVERLLLVPAEERQAEEAARLAHETAATKVDFFTMVRGED
ncbi:phosphonate C-P lyase system protein PhnG [Allorhizobium pseudoryzae]|uniref:phosphonate C-P lyase system protein PhnG n=1 Tax=Allorhizobium pseudoryzae TaxID=379684 RepID=UPI003D057BAC